MAIPGAQQIDPTEGEQTQRDNLQLYTELYGRRIYRYDAVSGAQITVQLDNRVILDDCTAIQYTLTQAKKPVYGYHSQLFDAVAPGIVIVHGRLWLNFIHQGYLRALIEGAKQGTDLFQPWSNQPEVPKEDLPTTTEDLIAHVQTNNQETLKTLSQRLSNESQLASRPDQKASVNIHITYGDVVNFTGTPVKVIYQAHFIGEGQDNQISGQPIQEWYEFIARRVT
ncbi:MAG: hypothetical protein GQ553_00900 [Nitrosomonadaceae bacterium]|nr:hypothetical protein [Nitrosomonadaceae bacterium]